MLVSTEYRNRYLQLCTQPDSYREPYCTCPRPSAQSVRLVNGGWCVLGLHRSTEAMKRGWFALEEENPHVSNRSSFLLKEKPLLLCVRESGPHLQDLICDLVQVKKTRLVGWD